MTRANDIASLVDSAGDIIAAALDNVPPSNDASALTTGTLAAARLPSGIGGLKSQQVFTSSGTWTKPSGITTVKVYVTGAGGGGGGPRTENATGYNGAGGGAGGTAIKIIDVTSVSSVSVTVGGGGTKGAEQSGVGANGNTGGTSSFGSYCSAAGGGGGEGGGAGSRRGGAGGIATGGDINIRGNCGDGASDTSSWESVSAGAPSYWGGGGQGAYYNGSGYDANIHGTSGGGGGGSLGWQKDLGGNGGDGIVVVEEYS